MTEVTQYLYPLRDVVEMFIKKAGVHEGHWALSIGMQISAGTFGPSPDQAFPGAMLQFRELGIQRHPEGQPIGPGTMVLDAAQVNPPTAEVDSSAKGKKRR